MAVAAKPISAGVLGMARTTGRPGAAASSVTIRTPAAIEITSVSGPSESAAPVRVSATSFGLTAATTTSAPATALAASATMRTPEIRSASSARRGAEISATVMVSAAKPASSSPAARASPIRPPPRTANCIVLSIPAKTLRAAGLRVRIIGETIGHLHDERKPLLGYLIENPDNAIEFARAQVFERDSTG